VEDFSQKIKIIKRIDKVDKDWTFSQHRDEQIQTCASVKQWNITKKFANTEARLNSFGLQVVDGWNSLPDDARDVEKLSVFQGKNSGKLSSRRTTEDEKDGRPTRRNRGKFFFTEAVNFGKNPTRKFHG
jgi:hypothetical protein